MQTLYAYILVYTIPFIIRLGSASWIQERRKDDKFYNIFTINTKTYKWGGTMVLPQSINVHCINNFH